MNKLKIFDNDEELIELPAESVEIILCRQLVSPSSNDLIPFILDNCEANWLRTEERQSIFKIIKKFFEVRETVPSEEMMKQFFKNKKFKDKEDDLLKEYEKILSFDVSGFDDKIVFNAVKTYIKSKSIFFTILNNIENIEKTGDIGDLLSKFEKILQIDMSNDLGVEYFENLDAHINELIKPNNKVPFGFSDLDKYTYGGLPVDDTCLFVIMAQPGLGKSQMMSNIAYNWLLKNKKVLIISLEMSENMYSKRFDALFTDINANVMKDHISTLKNRVMGAKAAIPNALLRIKEFPTGTLTSAMLRQYLKKLQQQKNFIPDILVVDYLNIMRPTGANAASLSLYEKSGRIAEELRAISSDLKIPIITGVQANRGTNGYAGENIDMSNVSESSGISATADAMVALYQLDGERENNRINVKILKNRLGGYVGNVFPLYVDYENGLKMSDWNHDTEVNDDVLGDVKIEDSTPKIKKKDDDESNGHLDSAFEEI